MKIWLIDSLIIAIPSGMLVLSYYPITGLTRIVSLCNAAWAAVAAYFVVNLAKSGVAPLLAIAIALLAAMGSAFLTYLISLRAHGFFQVMTTAAGGALIIGSISAMDRVTGGEQGLLTTPSFLKLGRLGLFFVSFVVLMLSSIAIAVWSNTGLGTRLVALRRLKVLVSLAGYSPIALHSVSYLASGLLAGLAGLLLALSSSALTPTLFNLQVSISVLAVFILSGGLSFPPRLIPLVSIQIVISFILQALQRSVVIPPRAIFSIYYALLAVFLFVYLRRGRGTHV